MPAQFIEMIKSATVKSAAVILSFFHAGRSHIYVWSMHKLCSREGKILQDVMLCSLLKYAYL